MSPISEDLHALVAERAFPRIKSHLEDLSTRDAADLLEELPPTDRAVVFRLLEKDRAIEVFEYLETEDQQELLAGLHDHEVVQVLEEMSPDDRTRLLDEMPAKVAKRFLEQLSPEERRVATLLLGYAPDSAGRLMTPEYVSIHQELTASQALEKIRKVGLDKETIYSIYITDAGRHLRGVVSLRDLVLADPTRPVGELAETDVISVRTDADQEEAARLVADYDLLALPVVDREDRLVGVITVDDAMDVLQEEATEDFQRFVAMTPDGGAGVDRYYALRLRDRVSRRLPWLMGLLLFNSVSGLIISSFESTIQAVIALTFFIPIIMDTAGNTGSQAATVAVRALATGEITGREFWRALRGELATGLLMGLLLAAGAWVMAYVRTGESFLGVAIGVALAGTVLASGLVGTMLPFLLRTLRIDPAVASAPFITSIGDVVGLVLYFWTARVLLHL
ncbi:magnesium transporter [Limnochorda pilosa]|uniref:Magnesium transporter MgtE n=1 Tax=Limnochorda pilosa TaxID=1555112 RepID=A0A0K2SHQ2_LIMPI|nr:magnesium transporter [Limnochorda pilosa]BAS26633.1 magnesium transporter [Limnochorda pilosa]